MKEWDWIRAIHKIFKNMINGTPSHYVINLAVYTGIQNIVKTGIFTIFGSVSYRIFCTGTPYNVFD